MRALAKRGPAPGGQRPHRARQGALRGTARSARRDRKSTRLNSSHDQISYAVFCLKKKNTALADTYKMDAHPRSDQQKSGDLIYPLAVHCLLHGWLINDTEVQLSDSLLCSHLFPPW